MKKPSSSSLYQSKFLALWGEKGAKFEQKIKGVQGALRVEKIYSRVLKLLGQNKNLDWLKRDEFLFAEVLSSGSELIKHEGHNDNFYLLGLFIEVKIGQLWNQSSFYYLILKMIKAIKNQLIIFSERLKRKLLSKVEESFEGSYLGELIRARIRGAPRLSL